MSDNISLAAGELTLDRPAPAAAGASTWTTGMTWHWELYFGVVLAGVLVINMAVGAEAPPTDRIVSAACLVAMAVWYVALGRRLVQDDPAHWQGYLFQAGMLALFGAATAAQGSTAFLLFALCPLIYMTVALPGAHGVIVAYGLAPAVAYLATTGDVRGALAMQLPVSLVVITCSTVFALTTQRAERLSLERAALVEQLAASRAEVARLSREAGVAEERQRLAGEIHDTVAQGLSSVVMLVEAADAALTKDPKAARRHLVMAARTARENLDEARAIVGALTPGPLTGTSLEDALRRVTARFGTETDIAASFEVEGAARTLPTSVEVVLLRVAQEALTNIRKHAGAHKARLRLAFEPGAVVVEVRDDGSGFDVDALSAGYGLGSMRSRVEQVGGRLTVHSAMVEGTTVRTEVDT